jgi:hypothetical protein
MSTTDLPIACTLTDDERASRGEEIDNNISVGVQSVTELLDGYEFFFPAGDEWPARLLNFINQERECCRFLTFELLFQPDKGPISMRLRGPGGAKEFIKTMI